MHAFHSQGLGSITMKCNLIWKLLDYFKIHNTEKIAPTTERKIDATTKNVVHKYYFFLFKHLEMFSMQL